MDQIIERRQQEGRPFRDPASKRHILHRSTDRGELVRQAKAHAQQFEDGLKAATRGISGAKFDAVRAEKEPARLDEKIKDENQPIHTIPDILAGRIGVDSREAHERTVSAVKSHFKVIRDEDEFEKGALPTNYRVHKLQANVTPQLSAEVHIVPREVLEANAQQHDVYEDARDADLEDKDALAAKKEKQAKKINDDAMDAFNERNAGEKPHAARAAADQPLVKGASVVLSDGRRGVIKVGNPNFSKGGKWVVNTDKGEVTVNGDSIKAAPPAHVDTAPIGKPIPSRMDQVKKLLAQGTDVRIFSARVADDPAGDVRREIEQWCEKNLGRKLPVTNAKDDNLAFIVDDKANVAPNADEPFVIPPIPKGKWLGVDLDRTLAIEKPRKGEQNRPAFSSTARAAIGKRL
jgi:hypothetical protein